MACMLHSDDVFCVKSVAFESAASIFTKKLVLRGVDERECWNFKLWSVSMLSAEFTEIFNFNIR